MNLTHAESTNALWANLLIEELLRHGINRFILSPGSRCAPITAAIARHPEAVKTVHFDERGAGFFAVGYGKATGRPAVVVCTSGTATANYYPAVVEASTDAVPMIVMTADRPPELHGIGANQTIDQQRLYGGFVRNEIQMPCPSTDIPAEFVLISIDTAVARATGSMAGPVHINVPFREPLAPLGPKQGFGVYLSTLNQWLTGTSPLRAIRPAPQTSSKIEIDDIARDLSVDSPGILVVGPLRGESEIEAARRLAIKLGWPVFADIRSGLRLGAPVETLIPHFDQLLLNDRSLGQQAIKILHIGGVLTSKRYYQFMERARIAAYVLVGPDPQHSDPSRRVTRFVRADISFVCSELSERMQQVHSSAFTRELLNLNAGVEQVIAQEADSQDSISEIGVVRTITREISSGEVLWLGSSMPIRNMDMFAAKGGGEPVIGANRGASGIDGSIASFLGFVDGSGRPGTAILGDLATLHDLNSLALVRHSKHPVTIVVINNNGGGIFSHLPIVECEDVFETYFGTPHGLTFAEASAMFKLAYGRVTATGEFQGAYRAARHSGQSTLIEVITDRAENIELHRKIQERIRNVLGNP